ncbi:MAG: hybrid sensor histidine kinase/response regulator [Acidimicrobiales bacterium]
MPVTTERSSAAGERVRHYGITSGKVLLIEDYEIDAERMTRWMRQIENVELEVIWATTLGEAVQLLAEYDPIVIVVDLTLPDASGLDCIHTILDHSPDCPIIVQTGVDDDKTPIAALELGAQDYLVKGKLDREMLERSLRHSLARHHTLQELTKRTNELHETDAELDDFAHVVAHDLRAPVRTARLFADRLVHSLGDSNSIASEFGERLDECLGRVDSMILSMLDYSALRQQFPETAVLPLDTLIKEVFDLVSADVLEVAASTTVDLDGELRVIAERDLFARVCVNILTNSVKYRSPDRPLHISVAARRVGPMVRLSFTDNGKGVPAEACERVFRILERLEPGATSGLGFGLAICRRIIGGFDGEIWMEPAEHVGTTVHVELPAG